MTIEEQIKEERQAILNAPAIKLGSGTIGRCSWCGQPSRDLVYVDSLHGHDRYKCVERCHAG